MKVCFFLDHSSVWENCGMKEEITGTAQEITLLFYIILIFNMHFNSKNKWFMLQVMNCRWNWLLFVGIRIKYSFSIWWWLVLVDHSEIRNNKIKWLFCCWALLGIWKINIEFILEFLILWMFVCLIKIFIFLSYNLFYLGFFFFLLK